MFAPLSIHLDSLKKVFYDKNELMRSGIELNKNFLIYTNENENKDFFVGYLSKIDDGTGFEISAGLFLNRRISVPRTILEKTFLGNIELSDSLGFDGTKLKVITLDTLEATLEEEGLPASAKAIKLLKQEIDSFVAGNLPPATIETIGGVIVGDGIEVDVEGTIRTPKSKNTKGSDIISNTGTTFLLNTGINVLNRNIDFDIEFSIINPSNSATKLFVSGSHIYVESTLSNFKGFSDGNITSVKGFVKDNLLHIYIENLCTSIVCDKIDGVDRDYPNNTVFVNKPFINKQELPIVDILKETVLNLKVMLFGINSVNDGLTFDGCNLALNTVDNLGTASSTKPLSAKQGKILNDNAIANFKNGVGADVLGYIEDGGTHTAETVWLSKYNKGEFQCLETNTDDFIDTNKWVRIDDLTNSNFERVNHDLSIKRFKDIIPNNDKKDYRVPTDDALNINRTFLLRITNNGNYQEIISILTVGNGYFNKYDISTSGMVDVFINNLGTLTIINNETGPIEIQISPLQIFEKDFVVISL